MKSLILSFLTLGSLCLSASAASAAGDSLAASACNIPDQTVRTFLEEARNSSGQNVSGTLQVTPADLDATRKILCQAAELVKSRTDLEKNDRVTVNTFWGSFELEVNEIISKFIEF